MQSKFKLVKMLADLGAPMIMSGAQANDPFGVPGFCLWEEMKLFVRAGIPIKDVLKMATYNTAEFFHETDSCGCIEAGRKANLVLLDKNPLESLDNLASREAIFIHGKYFTPKDLEVKMIN
jgi:imidazolonepropionase-like amidohydrolase